MDWTQVWTVLGVTAGLFLASIATTITLFVWNRSESRANNRRMMDILDEMKSEMKDFHGRLERLDSDFKNHFIYHHKEKK